MIAMLATIIQVGIGAGLAAVIVPPWIWIAGIIQRRWPA